MHIGVASTDVERESTYRFLNAEISEEHRLLLDGARSIDTKATLVAGFAVAAISFLLDRPRGGFWFGAVAAYGSALAASFAALWPRRWDGLKPAELHRRLGAAAPAFVAGRVAGTKVTIYESNHQRARSKIRFWVVSVFLLGFGIALSVVATLGEAAHE